MNGDKQYATSREHGERLAALEERMNHVATKAWVLGGVVTGMAMAITIGLGLAKLLL